MNALAQIPELPNEQLQPTKHGGDLHASWSKDHLDHLGFCKKQHLTVINNC